MHHTPSIIRKTYALYLLLYSHTKSFPKKDRFTLGQKCENILLEILETLFLANTKRDREKLPYLEIIDVKLKMLQTIIRLAHDAGVLEGKRYRDLSVSLEEIGRMLGGWMKSLR